MQNKRMVRTDWWFLSNLLTKVKIVKCTYFKNRNGKHFLNMLSALDIQVLMTCIDCLFGFTAPRFIYMYIYLNMHIYVHFNESITTDKLHVYFEFNITIHHSTTNLFFYTKYCHTKCSTILQGNVQWYITNISHSC